jgi:uncharacterized glyoxalase superfamily protein PhnB
MTASSSSRDGQNTVTAYLVVKDGNRALEFYARAFGAEETVRLPGPGGEGLLHGEMRIGNSTVMISDESVGSTSARSPESLGATSVTLHLNVEDVDSLFHQSVAAGCKVSMPLYDAFWGDRYGKVTDPFGHEWSMSTRVKELTPEELEQAAREYMNQPSL